MDFNVDKLIKKLAPKPSCNFGDIFFMSKEILKFGDMNKPKHYAIQTESIAASSYGCYFVPVTSEKHSPSGCFIFSLQKDSTVPVVDSRKSYAIFSQSVFIEHSKIYNPHYSELKGYLHSDFVKRYKKAVANYYKDKILGRMN